MNGPFAFDARELGQHVEWVRALARRLVADDHLADDLAQETWLAALRNPPERDRPIRPWLAAVLRNHSRQESRARRRRSVREVAQATQETPDSAAETVSEVETHRLLVDEVLALSEPSRSTILLHFFKGLSLAEIARNTGTPEGTIRSRLLRGLNALRARLGPEQDGDSRSLALTLLPLLEKSAAWPAASTSLASGAVMLGAVSKKLLLFLAVLLLIPTTWMLMDRALDPPADPIEIAREQSSMAVSPTPDQSQGAAHLDPPRSTGPETPISRVLEHGSPTKQTIVRGRFIDSEANPVPLVEVSLASSTPRSIDGGEPVPDLEDRTLTTGPDGRFEFQLETPHTYYFSCWARGPVPFVLTWWKVGEIEPDTLRDLGDLTLETGGTVLARVVNPQGQVIASGWNLRISRDAEPLGDGRHSPTVSGPRVAGSGSCRIDQVPPGRCRTSVEFKNGAKAVGPEIEVHPGQVIDLEIRYAGPDPAMRIVLTTLVKPRVPLYPERKHVRLSGNGIDSRQAEPQPYPQQSYVFDDVPSGRYTIRIDDPRFDPWEKTDIQPGPSGAIYAKLKGTSALQLAVRDRRTGAALQRYRVALLPQDWNAYTREIVLLEEKQEPPAGGLIDGLVAHDFTLRISADGLALFQQQLREFRPGEIRRVRADLVPGGTIAGVVVEADGATAAPGVSVGLYQPAEEDDGPDSPYVGAGEYAQDPQRHRTAWKTLVTDERGRFQFDKVPAGVYVLRATLGAQTSAVREGLEITLDEWIDELRIVLPAMRYLHGTIRLPSDVALDRVLLAAFPESGDLRAGDGSIAVVYTHERGTHRELSCLVAEDGGYRVGPLPQGPARVVLIPLALRRFSIAGGGRENVDAAGLDLGLVTVEETGDTRHDFDLRSRAPGRLELEVLVGGQPVRGLRVDANPQGRGDSLGVAKKTDQDGTVALQLFPGSWSLAICSAGPNWSYHHDSPVQIAPGGTQSLTLDVHLAKGALAILDSTTGEPLAGRRFYVRPDGRRHYGSLMDTDGLGRLHLECPIGVLDITPIVDANWRAAHGKPERLTVNWSAGGPDPATIRFSLAR